MVVKVNVPSKTGKTYKFEIEESVLDGKKLHEVIEGNLVSDDLEGYELEITGVSDKCGFTAFKEIEGIGTKKLLLKYGKGMHKKPKGEKKKGSKPQGLRLRKSVRGDTLSQDTRQVNTKVKKVGKRTLEEIFKPAEPTAEVESN